MLHAGGIEVRAEDGDLLVARRAEGLDSFESLLSVVYARRHAMYFQVWVRYPGGGGPFAIFDRVVRFDVAGDCGQAMSQRQGPCMRQKPYLLGK